MSIRVISAKHKPVHLCHTLARTLERLPRTELTTSQSFWLWLLVWAMKLAVSCQVARFYTIRCRRWKMWCGETEACSSRAKRCTYKVDLISPLHGETACRRSVQSALYSVTLSTAPGSHMQRLLVHCESTERFSPRLKGENGL
jgi:hypothetical protein